MKYNWPIIKLNEVDSTNIYANSLIADNKLNSETVISAYYQNHGRGQAGNTWESEAGQNLTFSIVLFSKFIPVEKQFALTEVTSLALCSFLGKHKITTKIKWPNDIYVGEKKIAGILIENSIMGNTISHSCIGVGLNVNQSVFSDYLPKATSMKLLTHKEYNLTELLNDLLISFQERLNQLKANEYDNLREAYESNLFHFNAWHLYKFGDKTFKGKIIDIKETGELVILSDDGKTSSFMFKEIVFL